MHRWRMHKLSGRVGGQIAILFIPLIAFLFILVLVTVNVGQMAQVRVETSNSADAGALAGASWMASGQNEAAWVSRKMWDTIWMTRALYFVPLCSGPGRKAYADLLWRSLADRRGRGAACSRRNMDGCGPNTYFHHVADAAMEGAWHVGSREYFTASTNNLLIRSGIGAGDCGLFGSCTPYGDVPTDIQTYQTRFYKYPDSPLIGAGIIWSNGMPTSDPEYRKHDTGLTLYTYPTEAPRLVVQGKNTVYAQYNDELPVGSPGFPYFACDFRGMANGIRNTDTSPSPVPEAKLPDTLPNRPLTIVASGAMTGYKAWDMELRDMIPAISQLSVGGCSAVCGMATDTTPSLPLQPASIQGGSGEVEAHTSHYVVSDTTFIPEPPFFSFVDYFQPVASEAIASYTAADVTSGAITDVPQRNAKAQLQSTR